MPGDTGYLDRVAQKARHRGAQVPAVLAAFVIGAVVVGVLAPDHAGDTPTAPSAAATAGEAAAGTTDAGTAETPTGGATTDAGGGGASPGATAVQGQGSAGGGAGTATTQAKAANNGGATSQGVTGTEIKVGILDLDSSSLGPICPRCGNGDAAKGGATLGLLKAWERDGLMPVNGRTIKPVFRITDILNPESNRNACVAMAQEIKPLLVVANTGTQEAAACAAQEFKLPVVSGTGRSEGVIRPLLPYFVETKPTPDRVYRNFAQWADKNGLLKGHKVGIYSPEDDIGNDAVNAFRAELKKLGVATVIDVRASGSQGLTNASDPVAVQQFRSAGVDVAFLFAGLVGFQNAAEGQAYRPKYPMAETGDLMTDAVADITYNVDAMDGNLGMNTKYWRWSQRKPAVVAGNDKAAYCIKAYQDYTKRSLDVFDNDAETHYVLWACTTLEIVREALVKAGPNLTPQTVLNGLYSVRGFGTSFFPYLNLVPNRFGGGESMATWQFFKERHQPENNYWRAVSDYTPFLVP